MLGTGAKIGIGVMGISIIGILVYVYVKSKSTVATPVAPPASNTTLTAPVPGQSIPTQIPVISPTAITNSTGGAGIRIFGMGA